MVRRPRVKPRCVNCSKLSARMADGRRPNIDPAMPTRPARRYSRCVPRALLSTRASIDVVCVICSRLSSPMAHGWCAADRTRPRTISKAGFHMAWTNTFRPRRPIGPRRRCCFHCRMRGNRLERSQWVRRNVPEESRPALRAGNIPAVTCSPRPWRHLCGHVLEVPRMKMKLVAALALILTLPAWSADPPATQPVSQTSKAPALTDDQIVEQFRTDMMSKRADIMAKGLTLTAEQASKFWPLFEGYQKEQDVIVNEQISATKAYAENYQNLSDADALAYVKALLDRDQKMLNV